MLGWQSALHKALTTNKKVENRALTHAHTHTRDCNYTTHNPHYVRAHALNAAGGAEQGPADAQNGLAVALPVAVSAEVDADTAPAAQRAAHDVHHPLHHHSTKTGLGVRETQGAVVHGAHSADRHYFQEENGQADQDGAEAQCEVQIRAHGATAGSGLVQEGRGEYCVQSSHRSHLLVMDSAGKLKKIEQ